MIFESFKTIFNSLDDDYLARLAKKNPKVLQNLCMFLSMIGCAFTDAIYLLFGPLDRRGLAGYISL